jgi:hypothetical protein
MAVAATVASLVSGAPSTVHAVVAGRSPFEAARAAATLVPGRRDRPGFVAGVVVHIAVSAGWGAVLGLLLPRRHTVAWGATAGLGIAALDLGIIARRKAPAIAALPQPWQWADHVAFGAAVGWVLSRADAAAA